MRQGTSAPSELHQLLPFATMEMSVHLTLSRVSLRLPLRHNRSHCSAHPRVNTEHPRSIRTYLHPHRVHVRVYTLTTATAHTTLLATHPHYLHLSEGEGEAE